MSWAAGDVSGVKRSGAYPKDLFVEVSSFETEESSGAEVEGEADTSSSTERVRRFLQNEEDIQEAFPEKAGFRQFIAQTPLPMLFGFGGGATLVGLGFITAGAVKTGATMGAGAPVGVPLMAFGLASVVAGVTSIVLGIVKFVKEEKYWIDVENSHISEEMKLQLKKDYSESTPRAAKMRLLAAKIKEDSNLSDETKEMLLQPYIGQEVKRGASKELRKAYELELLKAHFSDVEGIDDVSADNFEEYYREARRIAGEDPMENDIEGNTKAEQRQALSDYREENKLDRQFFKRLNSMRRKVDKEESNLGYEIL